MEIIMAAATDRGTVRELNEDFFYYSKKKSLVIVCDGMGGHKGGETASRVAGETVRDIFLYPDLAEIARLGQDITDRLPVLALRLVLGARLANRRLYMMAEQDPSLRGMGTTIAAMAFSEHGACAIHVGDSRIYRISRGNIAPLTEDHSWINELLQDRDISAEEAQHFRKKNVLTRALGTHPSVKIDVQWFPLAEASTFLLCTDGLHNALDDQAIFKALAHAKEDTFLQKTVEKLVLHAKEANGSDNITAAVVRLKKGISKSSPWGQAQMTIPNETAKLLPAEDRFIKKQLNPNEATPAATQKKTRITRRRLIAGAFILLLAASGYGVMRSFQQSHLGTALLSSETDFEKNEDLASAGVTKRRADITVVQIDSGAFGLPLPRLRPAETANADAQEQPQVPGRDSTKAAGNNTAVANAAPQSSARAPAADPDAPLEDDLDAGEASGSKKENGINAPTTSLVPRAGGRIYLPGLNRSQYDGALLFVNDALLGPVRNVADVGFFLRPGQYTIAVKDSTGRIMHQRANIKVVEGDVKPLEFTRQE